MVKSEVVLNVVKKKIDIYISQLYLWHLWTQLGFFCCFFTYFCFIHIFFIYNSKVLPLFIK